jgi:hypothetical protein
MLLPQRIDAYLRADGNAWFQSLTSLDWIARLVPIFHAAAQNGYLLETRLG